MMQLRPSFLMIPPGNLEAARRRLLDREPFTLHSVSSCWAAECPSCQQWKVWAREVRDLNAEIEMRSASHKKT